MTLIVQKTQDLSNTWEEGKKVWLVNSPLRCLLVFPCQILTVNGQVQHSHPPKRLVAKGIRDERLGSKPLRPANMLRVKESRVSNSERRQ